MQKNSRAFSLIELSIVILIIGIIIAGVTQGSRLVRQFKLTSAQTLTKSSPVASIKDLSVWFEPSLEDSFITSETEDGATLTQWNNNNPQSSEKLLLAVDWLEWDGSLISYSESGGVNGLPSLYIGNDSRAYFALKTSENCCTALPQSTFTTFVVYKTNDPDSYLKVWNDGAGNINYRWEFVIGENDPLVRSAYVGGNARPSVDFEGGSTSVGASEIASYVLSNSALNLYINGENANGISATPINITVLNNGYFGIYGYRVYVSELIVFNRKLKNEERQSVEEYLGKKYGIKVSKTGPAV